MISSLGDKVIYMTFTLDKVVPWGRSFDEYVAMFSLSKSDLAGCILGCGDGPASFNSILTKRGGKIISVDPLYRFSADEIKNRINETYHEIIEQTRKNKKEFAWNNIRSVEEMGRIRMKAMEEFLSDYEAGREEGRYVEADLPSLPFGDKEFTLAICSHFLFLYSEQLSEEFHIQSIKELCRVSNEVRIFPLLELGAIKSRHLEPVIAKIQEHGYNLEVTRVPYEFQKGGNEVLNVSLDKLKGYT